MHGATPIPPEVHQPSGVLDPLPFPLPVDHKRPTSRNKSKTKYVCKECGRDGWKSSSALARHEQSHLTKAQKGHICDDCGKSFAQRTALRTHQNTHTGDRPHECRRGCSQLFNDPSSRTRHENELHRPEFGWACIRPGCTCWYKRKAAFAAHMKNEHQWPKGRDIPEGVYTAAKAKRASDYYATTNMAPGAVQSEEELELETSGNLESDGGKSLFNGKRLRSGSISSDDHLQPPPAKKQAFDLNISRRNAVCSIEIPTPQPFARPLAGHKHSDSDDLSTSTASSYVDTFSGAYHPTGQGFINSSPPSNPLNSEQDYQQAIGRVVNPLVYPLQSTQMGVQMHPGCGYSITPPNISPPRAPVAMPEPHSYHYSSSGSGILNASTWSGNNSPYSSQWPLGDGVAQTPHGVSPVHMGHEDPPARGILPPSRSDALHAVKHSGINLPAGAQQAEHSSCLPYLDPRLGQAGGSFRDHQVLTRTPSNHSSSPHPDFHMQAGRYELSPRSSHISPGMPHSLPVEDAHQRSYS